MGTQRQIDMTFDISYPSEHPKFLQRLGEKRSTDILVQVFNKGVPYNLAGVSLGFEMRNDKEKILIDKDQSRFTVVTPLEGVFSYRPPTQVQSFYGNSYLAYFTLESGADRVTTERFRFYNDEDVQLAVAPELQEHYVSVIDDLVASNKTAMDEAKAIRDLINANGVVRKTGDTMTGYLTFDSQSAERGIISKNNTGELYKYYFSGGLTGLIDSVNNKKVWEYDNANQLYDFKGATNFTGNTNVVKKAGDTMTGDLKIDSAISGGMKFSRAGTEVAGWRVRSNDNKEWFYMFDYLSNGIALDYNPTDGFIFNKPVTVNGATNLVNKAGDTMTGNLLFDLAGTSKRIEYTDGATKLAGLYSSPTRFLFQDLKNNTAPWEYDYTAQSFNVNGTTNLMKKTDYTGKDGRATLTLTSDATNFDTSFSPVADRRGNTVTLVGAIGLKAGVTANLATTIPANMRPVSTISRHYLATDGTPVHVVVNVDGTVRLGTNGKNIYITETFVSN